MEPKQQAPYPLRMPPEMRSHYEDLAEASKRSLNAEIVSGLQELQALRNREESLRLELAATSEKLAIVVERARAIEDEARDSIVSRKVATHMLEQAAHMNTSMSEMLRTLAAISDPKPGLESLFERFVKTGDALAKVNEEPGTAVEQLHRAIETLGSATDLRDALIATRDKFARERDALQQREKDSPSGEPGTILVKPRKKRVLARRNEKPGPETPPEKG